MKRIKKQIRKISKESIKKILSGLVVLFFAMVMIFQRTETTDLQFVWNMDEAGMHNAPNTQWDYLFEDEQGQEVYQGQIGTGTTSTATDSIDTLVNPDEIENIFNELVNGTGKIISGTLYTGTMGTGTVIKTGTIKTGSLDCITPRKEIVKNKDFVLAYQQRKDVNTICNVEKRVCMSGALGGTFKQNSCRDDVVYEYNRAEVISYNQKVLNEYIQPIPPINSGAEFDTEGKINTVEKPTNSRGTNNYPITTDNEVNQTETPSKKSCTTSRGQKIDHGQFVKAYKAPRGFIDLPCEVQIRACVDGTLKGSYNNAKCTFNNTTYTDYLTTGSPSSNTGFLFFERVKNIFRRGR